MAKPSYSWSKLHNESNLLGIKKVDWSIFNYGMTIPVEFYKDFYDANNGETLNRGESHELMLIVGENTYSALLVNVDRKQIKTDTLQIRYDFNKVLKNLLKQEFQSSYYYIKSERKKNQGKKVYVKVDDRYAEYIEIYRTETPYCYELKLISMSNIERKIKNLILSQDEQNIEKAVEKLTDEEFNEWMNNISGEAKLEVKKGLRKIRKYNRSIIDRLKNKYEGKCQICGWSSLNNFNCDISEAHHIKYFSKSMDNSPRNIVILCPNHHRLIHKTNAEFDYETKEFICSNNERIQLKINYHL